MIFMSHAMMGAAGQVSPELIVDEPPILSGLGHWFSPDDLPASGQSVVNWAPKVGMLSLESARPMSVRFDSSWLSQKRIAGVTEDSQYLIAPNGTDSFFTQTFALFLVVHLDWLHIDAAANKHAHLIRVNGGSAGLQYLNFSDGRPATLQCYCNIGGANVLANVADVQPPQGVAVFCIRYSGSALELYLNGLLIASTPASGSVFSNINHVNFFRHEAEADPIYYGLPRGGFVELVSYQSALSQTDVDSVNDWLVTRHGIATAEGVALTGGNPIELRGIGIEVVGTTAHMLVADVADLGYDYYTADISDPHNWTLVNTNVVDLTNIYSSRTPVIRYYQGTWYALLDDRGEAAVYPWGGGDIWLYSGASLSTLVKVGSAPLFTGDNTAGSVYAAYRHPTLLPPDRTHDGQWRAWIDYRTDHVAGEEGGVVYAVGSSPETLAIQGVAIYQRTERDGLSGQSDAWDSDSMVAPDVYYDGSEYWMQLGGYNRTYRAIDFTGSTGGPSGYPHWSGLWRSHDGVNWSLAHPGPYRSPSLVAGRNDEMFASSGRFYPANGELFVYAVDTAVGDVRTTTWHKIPMLSA